MTENQTSNRDPKQRAAKLETKLLKVRRRAAAKELREGNDVYRRVIRAQAALAGVLEQLTIHADDKLKLVTAQQILASFATIMEDDEIKKGLAQ